MHSDCGTIGDMNGLLHHLPENIKRSFSGRNIFFHIGAALFTAAIVYSGFDWGYYSYMHGSSVSAYLWPAIALGGIIPIFSPIVLLLWGGQRRNRQSL